MQVALNLPEHTDVYNKWSLYPLDAASKSKRSLPALKTSSILVIEDDESLKAPLSRIVKLVDPNATLTWTTTTKEGLALLEEQSKIGHPEYDLILSDIFLPDRELGTALWYFCDERALETPFAFMSSLSLDQYLHLFPQRDVPPPFLQKPLHLNTCRHLIQTMLLGISDDYSCS